MDNKIRMGLVRLLNEGYSTQDIKTAYNHKVSGTQIGALRRSLNKYKTTKLEPKTNAVIEWLKR